MWFTHSTKVHSVKDLKSHKAFQAALLEGVLTNFSNVIKWIGPPRWQNKAAQWAKSSVKNSDLKTKRNRNCIFAGRLVGPQITTEKCFTDDKMIPAAARGSRSHSASSSHNSHRCLTLVRLDSWQHVALVLCRTDAEHYPCSNICSRAAGNA